MDAGIAYIPKPICARRKMANIDGSTWLTKITELTYQATAPIDDPNTMMPPITKFQ